MTAEPSKPPQVAPSAGADLPVYDPSANVLALVEAAVTRLNDLRVAETRRLDDLRELEVRHDREMQAMLLDFQDKLRDAEAKRIDAIRAVDVNAVAVASGRATDQAAVLATQVQVSADALRALVATTASTMATAQAAASAEFAKRLAELERSKYEIGGRSSAVDPQMADLLMAVKALSQAQSVGVGRSLGGNQMWGYVVGAIGLLLTMAMLFDRFK